MYPSEAELLLQLWGPVGIQAWISQQTWSNYLSLPLKHSALLQPKNLTSHEVPGSHKLCSLAYLLINIYIYFTFPSLCWLVLHLSIWLRAKKNPCLKNINMPFTLVCYLFISFLNIRGVGWFEWKSIRQGAKHGKFAALSAGTVSTPPT